MGRLTEQPAGALFPAFSPDGQKIAYASSADIYVVNADGSGVRRLTRHPAFDNNPSWQPRPPPCASERAGTESFDTIDGTAFDDCLLGLGGDDILNGRAGDDCLFGGPGDDALSGDSGKARSRAARATTS